MNRQFTIPILPIPEVVFFPHTVLPIHIEEPIYVKMVKKCVEENGHMGVCLAEPTQSYPGVKVKYVPKKICSIGKPVILEEYPEGGVRIIVKGVVKVRLTNVIQNLPYAIFEAEEISDIKENRVYNQGKIERLNEILSTWLDQNIPDSVERESFKKNLETVHHITDYICMLLIQDPTVKQLLLENHSLYERIQLINSLLKESDPFQEDLLVAQALKNFEHLDQASDYGH